MSVRCPRERRSPPDRRCAPPRISRLRLDWARGHQRWSPSAREHRARGGPGEAGADDEHHRADRYLAYPLGDAWRADAGERASAHKRRRGRGRAQRHHRELRVAARSPQTAGLSIRHPDRFGSDRTSDPRALQGRSARGCPEHHRGIQGCIRHRRDLDARTGTHGRRTRRQPAIGRHR